MLIWIMVQHNGSGNSFEVRLTSSRTRQREPTYRGKHRVYTRLVSLGEVAHRSERRHAGRGKSLPMCYPAYS